MMNKEKNWQEKSIKIPVKYRKEGNTHIIRTTKKSEKYFGQYIMGYADNSADAEKEFWEYVKSVNNYHFERSKELDKWKPLQLGDWSQMGGRWITVFGFHFNFRYGKGMKGGFYIPFTKFNISFTNYWRK